MRDKENNESDKSEFVSPKVEAPNGARKILLHCCCAPCSSAIVETLLNSGITPTIFYFNPNIFPLEEYQKRRLECVRYADSLKLPQICADFDYDSSHTDWRNYVKGLENENERGLRCQKCFDLRLLKTAQVASQTGLSVFATTLASSRWKDLAQIQRAGLSAQSQFPNTVFWDKNWRRDGLQNRRNFLIKRYEFYNQTYCGCEFSLSKNNKNYEVKY